MSGRLCMIPFLAMVLAACGTQPVASTAPKPLSDVTLTRLCLDAFESGANGDRAWLLIDTGGRFSAGVDDLIGPNFGIVTEIRNDGVTLIEIYGDGEGGWREYLARIEPCSPTEPKIDHDMDPE